MSIKSDNWIRRLAREGMIEPFEPNQVRTAPAGRVISYGTSSYGYDVRCAREFKIFTNINSTIVDPKSFDEKSFVDVSANVCIIPPNSFALASTVEYFRIPRDVLVICCGKSTYARCFRGDTRVALVDGTGPTLEQMARQHEQGERFWGYSIGPAGRIIVSRLDHPRYIGRDALLEITLDNGQCIHATADHVFLRRDGLQAAASELRPGDSLMPLYRELVRGDESVYQPIDGHLTPTHRLADEWNIRHRIYEALTATHRHHKDCDRRNNRPQNIERQPRARIAREIQLRSQIDAVAVPRALDLTGSIRGAARHLHRDRTVFRRFPEDLASFQARPMRNHRITAIRELPGDSDVYCLTVPEAGNFALEAGVFVHNCGIIVNVTPLEPEWEGHVTLEFSNTTPLPAKIYANEGVAQMLFFESDETCSTSYADRGGKYQGQRGVTLPKA